MGHTILCGDDPLPKTRTLFVIRGAGCSVLDASLEPIGGLDILLDEAVLVWGDRFAAEDGTDEVQTHLQSRTELERCFACLGLLSRRVSDRSADVIRIALALG